MVQGNIKTRILKYDNKMGRTFKENLKELLEYKDITLKELSYRTGISKRSIENYLNARASMPPADYACKIASAFDTTVEFLVYGNETKIPSKEDIKILELFKNISVVDKSAFLQLMLSVTNSNGHVSDYIK